MKRVCNCPNACIIRIALSYAFGLHTRTTSHSRHLLRNCLPCSGSVDFVHDKFSSGRPYKMLTVLDEYTRQALCVEVKSKMGSADVLEALCHLLLRYGKPEYIRSDNGSEFIAAALQLWLRKVGIKPIQIYPGSPWENGYNECFNGTLRYEVLNAEWFISLSACVRQCQRL